MTEPYYQDDLVTLYHGDCRQILPQLIEEEGYAFDLAMVDPPYGETSLEWDRWIPELPRMLSFLAPAMWMFGSLRMFMNHRHDFKGWKFSQDVIWEKHNGATFHADRFARVHETVAFWYQGAWADLDVLPQYTADATARTVRRKGRPAHTGAIGDSSYISEDGRPRLMRSVIQHRSMHGRAIHPTEKPTGLLEPLVRYAASMGRARVIDPTAGSGSTLAVCQGIGIEGVGIEADEEMCEKAALRLSQGQLVAI